MFHLGQEVVCVDDEKQHIDGVSKVIYKGKHYIISWVGNVDHPLYGLEHCVRLQGISRYNGDLGLGDPEIDRQLLQACSFDPELVDMPFRATRFRPVEKKETDISVFKEILNKVPEIENV